MLGLLLILIAYLVIAGMVWMNNNMDYTYERDKLNKRYLYDERERRAAVADAIKFKTRRGLAIVWPVILWNSVMEYRDGQRIKDVKFEEERKKYEL